MEKSAITTTIKTDQRLEQARVWLQGLGVDLQSDFTTVAGDASFRRYFRVMADDQSRILMDSPPPGEDVRPFVGIDQRLRAAGLHAPEINHSDWHNGYLLMEDLGDDLYRGLLHENNVDSIFTDLFDVLKQFALNVDSRGLPEFSSSKLRRDMDLFPGWYLDRHRRAVPRDRLETLWDDFCNCIIESAQDQPKCFVHRDFHSCNLLRTSQNSIGIIDFQDAVIGPLSYDLVSLIWDRYIQWPRHRITRWIEEFRLHLGLDIEADRWLRYCDLMGLQRNFKIVGIFARLYYRDGKTGYIEMIPQFYEYITSTLRCYPEFSELLEIMEQAECAP